jgi:hypothetical protein
MSPRGPATPSHADLLAFWRAGNEVANAFIDPLPLGREIPVRLLDSLEILDPALPFVVLPHVILLPDASQLP